MVGRGRTQDERLDNFVFGFYYSLQNFMTEGWDLFKKKEVILEEEEREREDKVCSWLGCWLR